MLRARRTWRSKSRPSSSTPFTCSAWAAAACAPRCLRSGLRRRARDIPSSTCSTRPTSGRSRPRRPGSIRRGRCSSSRARAAARWKSPRSSASSGRAWSRQKADAAGRHFVAITDPGTALQALAESKHYREVFLNPADIGGRFSALSLFGLVPCALIGADPGDAPRRRRGDGRRLPAGEPHERRARARARSSVRPRSRDATS